MKHMTYAAWLLRSLRPAHACIAGALRTGALGVLLPLSAMWMAPVSADTAVVATKPELGVYLGGGCDGAKRMEAFTKWLGRPPQRMLEFVDNSGWSNMLGAAQWASRCWARTGMPMTYSVPMLMGGKDGGTLAEGARGDFDQHFKRLAEIFIAAGHSDAIIRIGWEFNGNWYPWAASKDPTSWVKYWRRIAITMREVPGAKFRFDWNPSVWQLAIKPDTVYPGDDVVDIIGLDVYNQSWAVHWQDANARWKDIEYLPYGLRWHREFALAHGKQISYPEWGTGTRPDGHGGGDDPNFITNMHTWITKPSVAYHNYWEYAAPDYKARLSTNEQPLSAEVFLRLFR